MSVVRHVIVRGRVHGVGYRAFVERVAAQRGLEGWVRNRRDGTVEAVFSGLDHEVEAAIAACRQGPRSADVAGVDVREGGADLLARRAAGERFSVLATV